MWDLLILNPMINALLWLYGVLGDFTLSIIVFTILVKMITLPLTWQQQKSSKVMQDLQKSKEFLELQKKHGKDKQAMSQAQMALYKEKGINPLAGCLPTLIQFPVLIGLYQAITRVMATTPLQLFDLSRHVYPFLPNAASLVPIGNLFLWLNLGQPDPYYILPVLVTVTTWLQQKLITPPSADPSSAQMAQSMAVSMPLMYGFFALSFPSGLSIYFIVSNLVGVAQYALLGNLNLPDFVTRYLPALGRNRPAPVAQITGKSSSTKSSSSKSTSGKQTPAKASAKK